MGIQQRSEAQLRSVQRKGDPPKGAEGSNVVLLDMGAGDMSIFLW
jgi:hypothetical protein